MTSSTMTVSRPTLRVRDLNKELSFYTDIFNLQILDRRQKPEGDGVQEVVDLGFKEGKSRNPLLVLKHDPNAGSVSHNFAGLFHFAILVPDRKSLAYAYTAIERSGYHFEGFGDHLVSESLYLHDPERNGIEIYRDRPQEEWPHDENGRIIVDTLPLDLNGILSEIPTGDNDGLTFPNGATIGHIHLRITDMKKSLQFYEEKLGFTLTVDLSAHGATFLASGNYHHHIGMNTWHSLNGRPHEPRELGLDEFTVLAPNESFKALLVKFRDAELVQKEKDKFTLIDPDGIRVSIQQYLRPNP